MVVIKFLKIDPYRFLHHIKFYILLIRLRMALFTRYAYISGVGGEKLYRKNDYNI